MSEIEHNDMHICMTPTRHRLKNSYKDTWHLMNLSSSDGDSMYQIHIRIHNALHDTPEKATKRNKLENLGVHARVSPCSVKWFPNVCSKWLHNLLSKKDGVSSS
ncbi:hypothetical protein NPIL_133381 [Nephila pilipes]|uniref:Uncharacterized protein n=1 Tax=Nephila pilipes TaxID=299642 RepID=A0A8X6QIU1_NEPPI|nr:hypothetical protein NPIL_133381 [Nephila pilipes]